ncbi:MAG: hypothetical protein DI534_06410 [Leifsonia xyli]|nr:MAG: hypothetical protein DI534_06410 [Leifsonia xyli]
MQDALTARVMLQLEFHSAYLAAPAGYQFLLPEGRLLTLNDYPLKRTRALYFYGYAPLNSYRKVSAVLARPRGFGVEGAWFTGWPERKLRRAAKVVRYAIGFSYGGAFGGGDLDRMADMVLIDPMAPPERLTVLPGGHRLIGDEAGDGSPQTEGRSGDEPRG